ncbi:MAG: DinB family protein [Bryobacteraceae bacterium]
MTLCQTLTLDYDSEMKNTRKLLERVPLTDATRSYKPHEKSMALAYLATHVADLPSWFKFTLESQLFLLPEGFKMEIAATTEELLAHFDRSAAIGREWIDKATDEDMAKDWTFKYGEIFTSTEPRTQVVRGIINHLVHHRAQLGVYLRLNNIPIPGMYGPSADDDWK